MALEAATAASLPYRSPNARGLTVALHPPPPEAAPSEREREVRELFGRARAGDAAAREALVRRFLPLARQLAARYRRGAEPHEDLMQVASLALVKAVDRFELGRDVAFTSYAVPTILGELKRHFRDTGWDLHVPRSLQERTARVDAAVAELKMRHGRAPSTEELARELDMPTEEIVEALAVGSEARTLSLDAPLRDGDDDAATFGETLGDHDRGFTSVEDGEAVRAAMASLHRREREILRLRFVEELTQEEIGRRVGLSQMHISRLLRRTLARLREDLEG
jgi:RNA polymerase sigma-B factor